MATPVFVPIVLALAGAVVVGVLGFQAANRFRLAARIAGTPTTPAFQARPGPIEVVGVAMRGPGPAVEAPMSGERVIHAAWTIEKRVQQGKSSKWVVVRRGEATGPFVLTDDSGRILVDARGAEIDDAMPLLWREDSGPFDDPPERVVRFLDLQGVPFEGLFGLNHAMRYRERGIREGDRVYVLGAARPSDEQHRGTARHTVGAGEDGPLHLSTRSESAQLWRLRSVGAGLAAAALVVAATVVALVLFV